MLSSGTAVESAGVPPTFRAPRIVRVFAPPPAPPALTVQPAPQTKPQPKPDDPQLEQLDPLLEWARLGAC